jgi:hypothetical protein
MTLKSGGDLSVFLLLLRYVSQIIFPTNRNKFEKSSKFLSPPQADGVLRNFAPTDTDFS